MIELNDNNIENQLDMFFNLTEFKRFSEYFDIDVSDILKLTDLRTYKWEIIRQKEYDNSGYQSHIENIPIKFSSFNILLYDEAYLKVGKALYKISKVKKYPSKKYVIIQDYFNILHLLSLNNCVNP